MAFQTGVFNSSFNPAELNTRSFNSAILRLFPAGNAPLFGLTSQTKKRRAKSSTHGYFTKTFNFAQITFTGRTADGLAAVAADTALNVTSSAGLVPGMLFMIPATREIISVLTVVSATAITVTRGFGSVVAGAIVLNAVLAGVGSAQAEGSNRPVARRLSTTYVPNFTQIFRNAWALTDTARASLTEAGMGNVAETKRDGMLFHATDIEQAAFFGQAKMDLTGTQPVHTTQGLIDAVYTHAPANVNAAAATTNYSQLQTLLEPMFQHSTDLGNAKERIAFVDSQALRVLNDIGRLNGVVELTPRETTFGLAFTDLRFYKGTIRLIEHPMFNDLAYTTGMMAIIDLPAIGLAYMDGRDAKVEEYGVGGKPAMQGQDSIGGSLTSELAVETINPAACGLITGLTAGAVG